MYPLSGFSDINGKSFWDNVNMNASVCILLSLSLSTLAEKTKPCTLVMPFLFSKTNMSALFLVALDVGSLSHEAREVFLSALVSEGWPMPLILLIFFPPFLSSCM